MMSAHRFSIAEALRFGWRTTTGNCGFFIVVGILVLAITLGLNGAVVEMNSYSEGWAFILGIIALVAGIVLDVGLIVITLRFCDGNRGTVTDLFIHYPLGPRYFISKLIFILMVLVGMVFLIVPGVILALVFQFCGYHVVDEGTGAVEALRRSAATTRDARWRLFLFALLVLLINIAGFLCLLVGLLLTVPATLLAYAHVFRQLQAHGSHGSLTNASGG